MRIALIAHDSRKELMAQFCTAYVRILSENDLIATGVTGKIVHDATGLPVRTLYPGGRGGAEQIAAMIGCGEVDMLLFFRDPVGAKPGEPNDMMLPCKIVCNVRVFVRRASARSASVISQVNFALGQAYTTAPQRRSISISPLEPSFKNCRMTTLRPWPSARSASPMAAVVLPLPSPQYRCSMAVLPLQLISILL